jgi:hypothetical protein
VEQEIKFLPAASMNLRKENKSREGKHTLRKDTHKEPEIEGLVNWKILDD